MHKCSFVLLILALAGCKDPHHCDFLYHNTEKIFCANGEIDDDHKEKGRFVYWNGNDKKDFEQAGFYLNGLRNQAWTYAFDGEVKQITWAAYEDKNLHFRTNLFAKADSTKYGDFFTMFQYTTDRGKLNITIAVNGPAKDSSLETNYPLIARREFASINIEIMEMRPGHLNNNGHTVYMYELVLRKNNLSDTGLYYQKTAFGRIGSDFIEFTVNARNKDNFYAPILFEGVLTNLYLQGKRFYDPFTKGQ